MEDSDKKTIKVPTSLPPGWEITAIENISTVIMGQSPPSSTYNDERRGLPFYQGKAEFGDLYPVPVKWCNDPNKIAQKDDVLMSVRAPVGPTNLAPSECCIGRGLAAIRPAQDIPSKYILYYLRSIESQIDSLGTGTTFKAISGGTIRELPIPLAPESERQRIVAEIEKQFSRLDEAVANLKRVKANLKRYKAAVLKAAVEGKLTEEWRKAHPDVEPASELLKRIIDGRKSKATTQKEIATLNGDGLPQLPHCWLWVRMADVGDIQLGRQRTPRYHKGRNMRPYLRVQNVFEDHIDTSDVMEMDFPPADFAKYRLEPGDILLNEGQSPELLGRPAIYRGEVRNACFTNTLIRFKTTRTMKPEYPLIVFRCYMRTGRFTKERTITTNIAHLSAGRFANIEFPLPPLEEQEEIVKDVDRRISVIEMLENEVEEHSLKADGLRQSILQKAFLGEITAGA